MSEYRNGEWTPPVKINPTEQHAHSPQVAMDNNGNAIIIWEQYVGNYRIFKSEYRNGTWVHPKNIFDYISPYVIYKVYNSEVAMDDNGNAIIVWSQRTGTDSQIFMSEYRNGTWKHPADLTDNISPDGSFTSNPRVAIDNNGNAIIIWTQFINGVGTKFFMSEYRNNTWTHPADLNDNILPEGSPSGGYRVAMDNNGDAIIVWVQSDGDNNQIFKSEFR